MPFTLSHPAAVLPLLRSPFSAVGLVAGAVAPDLPYFVGSVGIAVTAQSWYEPFLNATTAHSPSGAVTVDLVYALALCLLARVLRRPVRALLPVRAAPDRRRDGARALVARAWWVLLSAVVGIATHLVWDSFTHGDGYVVTHLAWLRSPLAGDLIDLTWARALQHLSTLVGLAAVGGYLWRRRSALRPPTGRRRLAVLAALAAVALAGLANAATGLAAADGTSPVRTAEAILSSAAKGAGAALLAVLVGYAALWWLHHAATARRRAGD